MDWEAAACRQQVAEWRDRELLTAAATVNGIAAAAAAVPVSSGAKGFDDLRPGIDALIRARCEAEIAPWLNAAARRLRAIHPGLEEAALALLRDGWPTLPPAAPARAAYGAAPASQGYAANLTRRVERLNPALVAEGLRMGAAARAVLDRSVRAWTGFGTRMRAEARAHATARMLAGTAERPAVLEHLDAAVERAAAMARGKLA